MSDNAAPDELCFPVLSKQSIYPKARHGICSNLYASRLNMLETRLLVKYAQCNTNSVIWPHIAL